MFCKEINKCDGGVTRPDVPCRVLDRGPVFRGTTGCNYRHAYSQATPHEVLLSDDTICTSECPLERPLSNVMISDAPSKNLEMIAKFYEYFI